MKTKFFKFGLPVGAFMAAIAFAFASEQKDAGQKPFVTGYIFQANQCRSVPKNCNEVSTTPCTYLGFQVWRTNNNGTSCSDILYHQDL